MVPPEARPLIHVRKSLIYTNDETHEPATAMEALGLLFHIKAAALDEIPA